MSGPHSGRGRPSLAWGSHGAITTTAWVIDRESGKERRRRSKASGERRPDSRRVPTVRWTAEAYVQTDAGRRKLQGRGTTKDDAIEALQRKLNPAQPDLLADALATERGHGSAFTDQSALGDVLDAWISDPATIRARSVGTLVRYRHAIDRSIKGRKVGTTSLGRAPLDRVTPRVVTLFLASLTPAVAKTCRGILRQALTYAVANGANAPTVNGTFAILSQRVERGRASPVSPTVAITKADAEKIIADLRADPRASRTDLPDLLRFISGTGCRTSEATALSWSQLDLDGDIPTVVINATVNGAGQRQTHTKTRAGVRRLALPPAVVTMLKDRQTTAEPNVTLIFSFVPSQKPGRVETPYWTSGLSVN